MLLSIGFGVLACGSSTPAPIAEPAAAATPATAAPAPAAAAPATAAPTDPLAGLSRSERWRWAIARMPSLAAADRAPKARFDAFAAGPTVSFYSPDLAESLGVGVFRQAPCTKMDFALDEGRLVTHVPVRGGVARPGLARGYVGLTLAETLELGPFMLGPGAEETVIADWQAPLLSAIEAGVVRYQGEEERTVECRERVQELRCDDGTVSECRSCELALASKNWRIAVGRQVVHGCGPCPPPDENAALEGPLRRVVEEERVIDVSEGAGPSFFRDPRSCRAAARHPPGPEPFERAYGVSLHPDLDEVCTFATASGRVGTRYETALRPQDLVLWLRARVGAFERAGDVWRHGASGDPREIAVGPPERFRGLCDEPFGEDTRAVAEISVAPPPPPG